LASAVAIIGAISSVKVLPESDSTPDEPVFVPLVLLVHLVYLVYLV
jgi:hypothetical protein